MPIAVETYGRLAKARLHRSIQRMLPMQAENPQLAVEVLTGLHSGMSAHIIQNTFSIGAESKNDLMLLDDEALGDDVCFTIEGSLFGPLLGAKTTRSDIRINGTSIAPNVALLPEPLPCEVDFNSVRLRVRVADVPRPSAFYRGDQAATSVLMTVALIAFAAQIYLSNQSPSRVVLQATEAPDPASTLSAEVAAEKAVKNLIMAAGLSGDLTVANGGQGTIAISGVLLPDLMAKWRNVRSEIDRTAASVVIVSDVSETQPLTNMPTIGAVRLGDDPAVILATGEKLVTGDRITGEWVITEIKQDAIQLQRGEAIVNVTF